MSQFQKIMQMVILTGFILLLFYLYSFTTNVENVSLSNIENIDPEPIANNVLIEKQNKDLQSTRQNTCNNQSLHGNNCICDYINSKGLQKSGTSWMIASLKQIQIYFCNKKLSQQYIKDNNIEICIHRWHLGSYDRHPLVLPHQINNKRLLTHYANKNEFLNELQTKRFCSITVFRDPRDRKVSWTYWGIRNNKAIMNNSKLLYAAVNRVTMHRYKQSIYEYNQYWDTFRHSEFDHPMKFYNYFYHDMVLDPFNGIKNMLLFIGFYNLNGINFGDSDIHKILNKITSDALIKFGANILYRKGKICGFHDELTPQNAEKLNIQTAAYLKPELIELYNLRCKIPQFNQSEFLQTSIQHRLI